MLTAKNRDQLRNPMLGNRVWAAFTFYVKNQVIWVIIGTQKPEEISDKYYLACLPQLKKWLYLVKDRCYQISIVSLKNWMHLK